MAYDVILEWLSVIKLKIRSEKLYGLKVIRDEGLLKYGLRFIGFFIYF